MNHLNNQTTKNGMDIFRYSLRLTLKTTAYRYPRNTEIQLECGIIMQSKRI